MKERSISDRDPTTGALAFDLRDILAPLGRDGERSAWSVRDVECLGGDAAQELHDASDSMRVLTGSRLIELARAVGQVIEGEFSGRLPGDVADWIVIRAVDSSAFDVYTDQEEVLSAFKSSFGCVEDLEL